MTLDTYPDQFRANAVVNGITEEDWQQHLATLESIGAYDYVELWQSFYDAHQAS